MYLCGSGPEHTDLKTICISLNGSDSETRSITCGLPQRFVMSPILFLLYINDLPSTSKHLNFFLFADDTYLEDSNFNNLEIYYE